MMAYISYHSHSEAYRKREFFNRKNVWIKHGDCHWVFEHEDTRNEGRRYALHQKVRIGERRWEAVPLGSLSLEEKNQIWEDLPKITFPPFQDAEFEKHMTNLPKRLQIHPVLTVMAPNFENVSGKKFWWYKLKL